LLSPYKQEVFENSSFEAPCRYSDSKAKPSNEMILEDLELSEKKSQVFKRTPDSISKRTPDSTSKRTPDSTSKRTPDSKPTLMVNTSEKKKSASSIKNENTMNLLSEKKSNEQKEESIHSHSPSMKQELILHDSIEKSHQKHTPTSVRGSKENKGDQSPREFSFDNTNLSATNSERKDRPQNENSPAGNFLFVEDSPQKNESTKNTPTSQYKFIDDDNNRNNNKGKSEQKESPEVEQPISNTVEDDCIKECFSVPKEHVKNRSSSPLWILQEDRPRLYHELSPPREGHHNLAQNLLDSSFNYLANPGE
jgi:hypothetical protein